MLLGCALDVGIIGPMLVAGLWANSLTLLGEYLRAGLLTALEIYLFSTLRRIHRRRFGAYDYGAGKLEQFGNLLVGGAMLLAAAWILGSALFRLTNPPSQPAFGIAAAAAVALVNFGINAVALVAVGRAGRDGTSIILTGQIRSRISKFVASALATAAIAVNAVWGAEGPGPLGDVADSVLVVVVVVTMVALGAGLWRDALPPLLDRSLDETRQVAINQVLARHFRAYDALGAIRSRVLGREAIVKVTLGFAAGRSIGEIRGVADAIAEDIRALSTGALVTVTPVTVGAPPRGP